MVPIWSHLWRASTKKPRRGGPAGLVAGRLSVGAAEVLRFPEYAVHGVSGFVMGFGEHLGVEVHGPAR